MASRERARDLATPYQSDLPNMRVITSTDQARDYLSGFGIHNMPMRVIDVTRQSREVADFLIGRPHDLLARVPPTIIAIPDSEMEHLRQAMHFGQSSPIYAFTPAGMYLAGSNLIIISETSAASLAQSDDVAHHEIFHYASFLGRGMGGRVLQAGPGTAYTYFVPWMEEGMTEFFTSRLEGREARSIEYPFETGAMAYISHIVGEYELRQAFASDDPRSFERLREAFDRAMGREGAFAGLIRCQTGGEAIAYMVSLQGTIPQEVQNDPIWMRIFPPSGRAGSEIPRNQ